MRKPLSLGDLEFVAGCLDNELHMTTESGQHINQRVRAEQVDPTAEQVADARLGHP